MRVSGTASVPGPEGISSEEFVRFRFGEQHFPSCRGIGVMEGRGMSNMEVVSEQVTLTVAHGLHLTPISQIVRLSLGFESAITISFDGKAADAKSAFDLMLLAAPFGARLTLEARGSDAQQALNTLADLFRHGFAASADQ